MAKANGNLSFLFIREAVTATVACLCVFGWINSTTSLSDILKSCSVTAAGGRGGPLEFALDRELLTTRGKNMYWTWKVGYNTKNGACPPIDAAERTKITTASKDAQFYAHSLMENGLAENGLVLSVPATGWSFPCDVDSKDLVFRILGWEENDPASCVCVDILPEKTSVPHIPVLSAATENGVAVPFGEDSSPLPTIDIDRDITISLHGQETAGTVILYAFCDKASVNPLQWHHLPENHIIAYDNIPETSREFHVWLGGGGKDRKNGTPLAFPRQVRRVKRPAADLPPTLNDILSTCVVTVSDGHNGDLIFTLDDTMAQKPHTPFTWAVLPVDYMSSSPVKADYAHIADDIGTLHESHLQSKITVTAGNWNYPLDWTAKQLPLRLMAWHGDDKASAVVVELGDMEKTWQNSDVEIKLDNENLLSIGGHHRHDSATVTDSDVSVTLGNLSQVKVLYAFREKYATTPCDWITLNTPFKIHNSSIPSTDMELHVWVGAPNTPGKGVPLQYPRVIKRRLSDDSGQLGRESCEMTLCEYIEHLQIKYTDLGKMNAHVAKLKTTISSGDLLTESEAHAAHALVRGLLANETMQYDSAISAYAVETGISGDKSSEYYAKCVRVMRCMHNQPILSRKSDGTVDTAYVQASVRVAGLAEMRGGEAHSKPALQREVDAMLAHVLADVVACVSATDRPSIPTVIESGVQKIHEATDIYIYTCIYIYMCVYVYIYIYLYLYMYIYI